MFATATMRIAEATLIDEDDPSRGLVVFLQLLLALTVGKH